MRGEHVQAAAREGDEAALAVVDEFARWVALGLVNLTNILDPAMFVLGGGLAEGADLYLEPIEQWFGALLYSPQLRPHPDLAFAVLGERAGAIGAALAAAERVPETVALHQLLCQSDTFCRSPSRVGEMRQSAPA